VACKKWLVKISPNTERVTLPRKIKIHSKDYSDNMKHIVTHYITAEYTDEFMTWW